MVDFIGDGKLPVCRYGEESGSDFCAGFSTFDLVLVGDNLYTVCGDLLA